MVVGLGSWEFTVKVTNGREQLQRLSPLRSMKKIALVKDLPTSPLTFMK